MDDALKETTRKTARMLFHSIKSGVGFDTWKSAVWGSVIATQTR